MRGIDVAIQPPEVKAAFGRFTPNNRDVLRNVRRLILDLAAGNPRIGPLTETLKWSEPAYLTEATKDGSTLRLGETRGDRKPALFVNWATMTIESESVTNWTRGRLLHPHDVRTRHRLPKETAPVARSSPSCSRLNVFRGPRRFTSAIDFARHDKVRAVGMWRAGFFWHWNCLIGC